MLGPRLARLVAAPVSPASSDSDSVARAPAMAQTAVDTSLGLMPARRARSGHRPVTALPRAVRFSIQVKRMRDERDQHHDDELGPGDPARRATRAPSPPPREAGTGASTSGNSSSTASDRLEMPMVATSTMTRGGEEAADDRQLHQRAPEGARREARGSPPARTAREYCATSRTNRPVPIRPRLATAKLMTRSIGRSARSPWPRGRRPCRLTTP